jgi:threonine dehydrogenase-like Zn-dependent dehydrogenase
VRATVLRDGKLEVRETADPVPGSGQLLLRTLSSAICASDVHYMDHAETIAADESGLFGYDPNRDIVMGHEFAGEVVAYGPDCVGTFPIGARVTAMPMLVDGGVPHVVGQHPDAPGAFGELMLVTEAFARAIPDDVPNDAAALVDAFAVGEGYVALSKIGGGEVALVIGAGAVGLSAIAALALREVDPIVVSDYNADRLELAKRFGAHAVVNPAEQSPYDVVRELRAQRAYVEPPVIFECVGATGLIQSIIESCEPGSRIYAAGGWYTDDTIPCSLATRKGVEIRFGGAPREVDWFGTLDAVCGGRLDPSSSVGMVIGLDQVPEGIDMARKAQGPPRIIVHPNG